MTVDHIAQLKSMNNLKTMRHYLQKIDRMFCSKETRNDSKEVAGAISQLAKLLDSLIEEKPPAKEKSPTKKMKASKE